MTDAIRDGNHVPVALAVSTSDATATTPFTVDPATGKLQIGNAVANGTNAPVTTPTSIGQFYVATSTSKLYVSTCTTSSACWTILN